MSLQVVSTVRRDNVQFFTKRRLPALFWLTRTSPGANFHMRTCMYGTFHIRNHDRVHWFDPREGLSCVFTVKNVPRRNFLTYMDMFPRNVSTTRRGHARVHTLKDRCLLTFWVTKSFLCVALNIWHHVGHQIFHKQVETMYNRPQTQLGELTALPQTP